MLLIVQAVNVGDEFSQYTPPPLPDTVDEFPVMIQSLIVGEEDEAQYMPPAISDILFVIVLFLITGSACQKKIPPPRAWAML